jgi:hypothetical protein
MKKIYEKYKEYFDYTESPEYILIRQDLIDAPISNLNLGKLIDYIIKKQKKYFQDKKNV